MSGPKVVHIVTREELVARCELDLARLDAAIVRWNETCARTGAADPAAAAGTSARRDALQQMIIADRFADLQKQVAAEISFLNANADTRIRKAAERMALARQSRRRAARTSEMLLRSLAEKGRSVPEDLRRSLEGAVSSAEAEAAISRAFALLSEGTLGSGVTDRQRELAAELGRDEKRLTFADWLAAQRVNDEPESILKIDRYLGELATLGGDTSPFEARAAALSHESKEWQPLLADSLLLDLADSVRASRERAEKLQELRRCAEELARYTSEEAQRLQARLDAAVRTKDVAAAQALVEQADALIQEELRSLGAEARRHAVLEGLASLGYSVHEGMATAWVQGGRVAIRKAANPALGIELAGGSKSDRLQVRAVRFGSAGGHPAQDRDVETAWCSELTRLRALLSEGGANVEIEQALPAGAAPLKIIEEPNAFHEDASGSYRAV